MVQIPNDILLSLDAHKTWLESNRKEGGAADLSGKDLSFVDFSGLDLSGIILDEANLERASLAGCKFLEASLQRANLSLADITGTDFSGANLAGANLSDTAAVLSFEKAILDGANLQRVKYSGCHFKGASLQRVEFRHAMLEGSDFSGANMASAELGSSNLEGAVLDRAILDGASFDSAVLRKVSLRDTHAVITSFNRADLSDCVIEQSKFALSHLEYATLIQASLVNSRFDGASLCGANFSRATVENCSFRGADLRKAQTTAVDFESSNLIGAKTDQNAARYAGLVKAKLTAKQRGWLFKQRKWAAIAAHASVYDGGATGVGYSPELEAQLQDLLNKSDALQQRFRRQPRGGQTVIESDFDTTQAEIDQLRDQRSLIEAQIKREHETVRKQQEELRARVTLAVNGLKIAVAPLTRHINSLRAWYWLISGFGVAFLGLAIVRVAFDLMRNDGIQELARQTAAVSLGALIAGLGYGLAMELLLVTAGVMSLWLASRLVQPLSHWVARRDRLFQWIAVLVASQHVDFEINAKQSNVNNTFEAVRGLLLNTDVASEQSN
ncbi:MAG: pentapeptide repeat-containing protein [Candidatus Accumulibacter phosphatis]|uniref:pentapeptide repeat-containing protein n=1 Tax=Candidatus Accumulibacter sp. ACC012 TaxID=2823332 RepID=UPI0025C66AB8|nr:pentapeptide repeat-containing protein [Candidatus Accumulibacter sp. ACC012]